ncbi:histidine kinase [Paenibacillus dokdonensis]|uniref:histidine kinase n=1 Tax=Paenibacillus dokdonensis TaxID=2567944 RepID=A0ABU6GLD9_9BACL|nr:histidine kinase [Paenibacillus dokdonensis]MEC0240571.1 histidine kinase [Paenibacillus dokdonensis]
MIKDKPLFLLLLFRIVIVLFVAIDVVTRYELSTVVKAATTAGILAIQANDFGRATLPFFKRNRAWYALSMVASIVGIGLYMIFFDSPGADLYYFFPLAEIFLYSTRLEVGLVIVHILVFLTAMIMLKASVVSSVIPYMAMLMLVYLFRNNSLQRKKNVTLSAELLEANAKLKEITIVRERTRIAQELHDSIGHGLVAIRMHLEYAENTVEKKPEKSKEVIHKALSISQKSIADLRKAVSVLKEAQVPPVMHLQESLQDMIESLQLAERLKFDLKFDPTVEDARLDIKQGVYNTVREAVTNGMKHGDAESFVIAVEKKGPLLHILVENDGAGCTHIHKSHGLHGIEERIDSLQGTVRFSSAGNRGFAVMADIPYFTGSELN